MVKDSDSLQNNGSGPNSPFTLQSIQAAQHSFISFLFMKLFNSLSQNLILNLSPKPILSRVAFCIALVLLTSFAQAQEAMKVAPELEGQVRNSLKENAQTIRFVENKGQYEDSSVLFYYQGKEGDVLIEKNRIRFVVHELLKMKVGYPLGTEGPDALEEEQVSTIGEHVFFLNFSEQVIK